MNIFDKYPKIEMTFADKVCVYPIAQQVVGLGTIASNVCKAVYDLCETFFYKISSGSNNSLDKLNNVLSLKASNENLKRHLSYIHLGVLRFIPIVATKISLERCSAIIKSENSNWKVTQVANSIFEDLTGKSSNAARTLKETADPEGGDTTVVKVSEDGDKKKTSDSEDGDKKKTSDSEDGDKKKTSDSEDGDKKKTSDSEDGDKKKTSDSEDGDKKKTSDSENGDTTVVKVSEGGDTTVVKDSEDGDTTDVKDSEGGDKTKTPDPEKGADKTIKVIKPAQQVEVKDALYQLLPEILAVASTFF